MVDFDVRVRRDGPAFNGRAERVARQLVQATEDELADSGVNLVLAQLGRVLQHPTGYYESQIRTDRQGGDAVVTDGGVIYGPWLEGVGSRNRTTRFKGYFTFRRVSQRIDRQAQHIAQRVLPKYLQRMQ